MIWLWVMLAALVTIAAVRPRPPCRSTALAAAAVMLGWRLRCRAARRCPKAGSGAEEPGVSTLLPISGRAWPTVSARPPSGWACPTALRGRADHFASDPQRADRYPDNVDLWVGLQCADRARRRDDVAARRWFDEAARRIPRIRAALFALALAGRRPRRRGWSGFGT